MGIKFFFLSTPSYSIPNSAEPERKTTKQPYCLSLWCWFLSFSPHSLARLSLTASRFLHKHFAFLLSNIFPASLDSLRSSLINPYTKPPRITYRHDRRDSITHHADQTLLSLDNKKGFLFNVYYKNILSSNWWVMSFDS